MNFVSLQRSIVRVDAGKLDPLAQIVLSRAAQEALFARHAWLDGDSVSGFYVGYPFTALDNDAGPFVAEDAVSLDNQRSDSTRLPEVHIRATDARCLYVDERLARSRRIDGGFHSLQFVVCRDL